MFWVKKSKQMLNKIVELLKQTAWPSGPRRQTQAKACLLGTEYSGLCIQAWVRIPPLIILRFIRYHSVLLLKNCSTKVMLKTIHFSLITFFK
ncbi:hypothetical protein T4B_3504 [Trichinella pseudospiralis]|uniref:Uncharacterized protein n=2 Tax=Trichinella pseudospiralis TaxID=6337 RepID=A0A0V1G2L4_TRIPS|nr:hypothetical protein T4D_9679 [Trichinella pseudospiralis]KRZ30850.1 hypothetical protein T4B_3504 [Trichinella pseudospiralis]KRZ46048.1 hypothetical protein T4C_3452 [Trichinella pseudospiralis]